MLTESRTIRIGTQGTQTNAYMAGITGTSVSGGSFVVVTPTGQLGTTNLPPSRTALASAQSDSSSGLAAGISVLVPTNVAAPAGYTLLGRTTMSYEYDVLINNQLTTKTATKTFNLYQKD